MAHKKRLQVWGRQKIPRYIFGKAIVEFFCFTVAAVEVFMQQVIWEIKNELFYGQMKQLKFHLKLIILKCV